LSVLFGVLTATGFGSADFIAKLSTDKVGFLRTALFMQVVGSFFVLPFALADVWRVFVHPAAAFAGVLLGVVNAFATLCLYRGFEVGRLSIVSPIASTAPIVSILLAVLFLGEAVTDEHLLSVGIVILGIILVCIQNEKERFPKQIMKGTWYAFAFMVLGGSLLFGLKPVSDDLGVFLPVLLIRWVSALVVVVPFLSRRSDRSNRGAYWLIPGIAFLDTFANVAYDFGVSLGTVTVVSTLGGMFSAVTVLLARVILKERLSHHQIVGFATIVVGVAALTAFG
jgi:drug/metabolite transporter (DMT)-like permease